MILTILMSLPFHLWSVNMQAALPADRPEAIAQTVAREGGKAPDFTLKTPDGTPLRLSSLRGKYVLLDFWGSWCYWCIKGVPKMKEAYAKHQDKVVFLSIACRDTEERWRDALEELQMPWIQVKDDVMVGAPSLYGVHGYPTKVLVNPDGTVNFIFEGEDSAFYDKLDAILSK